MSYALVTDGTIDAVGPLPRSARRLDNDAWVMGLASAPTETREACGWFEVVNTDRPADTATTTHDRSIELVEGVPTVVWTERDWTSDELAQRGAVTPEQAAEVVAKLLLAPKVRAEELTDAELAEVAPLFPAWDGNGVEYTAGDVVRHLGELYEVNEGQGHTSQPDWAPDVAVSLFKAHRPAGEVTAWVQPIAPDFYPLDAVVTHNGSTWKSLHPGNVWEPGTVGTEALWEQVG